MENSKLVINLEDGSFVEISGSNVRHITRNGEILYDSDNRILYNKEQLEAVTLAHSDESVEKKLEAFRKYLEEDIDE